MQNGSGFDYKFMLLIILVGAITYILNLFLVSYWQEKIVLSESAKYEKKTFSRILEMPQYRFQELGDSYLLNSIMMDAQGYARYNFINDVQLKGHIINGTILFLILLYIHPVFAVITLVGVMLYYFLLKVQGAKLERRNTAVMKSMDDFLNTVKQYAINNTAIVKSENTTFYKNKLFNVVDRWVKNRLGLSLIQVTLTKVPVAISFILPLVTLYLGALSIESGVMGLGTLMMFIQIQALLFTPVNMASVAMADLRVLSTHKKRMESIYTEVEKQRVIIGEREGISIKDATIKTADGRLLYNGSLDIGSTGFYIIKGANGTGKSTLLRAFIGNLSPEQVEGDIYINKELINDVTFFKYPLFIFKDNVLQNILGAPGLEKNIDLDRIVSFNPPDLEKDITLDPLNLSSGEAQKVVLLREISKDSKMVFLDEPTTNLDTDSVDNLMNYIEDVKDDKLIISIMHDDIYDGIADGFIYIEDKKLWMEGRDA